MVGVKRYFNPGAIRGIKFFKKKYTESPLVSNRK
jgi:hypothetical protein